MKTVAGILRDLSKEMNKNKEYWAKRGCPNLPLYITQLLYDEAERLVAAFRKMQRELRECKAKLADVCGYDPNKKGRGK